MPVSIDLGTCIGSSECVKACAFNAIDVIDGKAVVYENCVDCDACVRACPTHAIISSTPRASGSGTVLVVDFADRSGIMAIVERAARRTNANAIAVRVDPSDAGAAADAVAQEATSGGYGLVVLPHAGAGPAIAARVAARLSAALLSGCTGFTIDDAGVIRATRLRYGGIVKTSSRVGPGTTVVTLVQRVGMPFAARVVEAGTPGERTGDAPSAPEQLARVIVALGPDLSAEAQQAARAIGNMLAAAVVEAGGVAGKKLAPELYIALGVPGSTDHNASVRAAGTIVAIVANDNVPIAQIANYVLVGDVSEHARVLLSAL